MYINYFHAFNYVQKFYENAIFKCYYESNYVITYDQGE